MPTGELKERTRIYEETSQKKGKKKTKRETEDKCSSSSSGVKRQSTEFRQALTRIIVRSSEKKLWGEGEGLRKKRKSVPSVHPRDIGGHC